MSALNTLKADIAAISLPRGASLSWHAGKVLLVSLDDFAVIGFPLVDSAGSEVDFEEVPGMSLAALIALGRIAERVNAFRYPPVSLTVNGKPFPPAAVHR